MNDDDLELASAYLDDEVTDAERARVETSPELLQLVEQMRSVRDSVGATGPPSAATRDAAVAAALAAFDAQQIPAPPPNVVPIERSGRWRWRHGLGVAAAAVVVVAGIAILRDNAEAPSEIQTAERASTPTSIAPAALDAGVTPNSVESDNDSDGDTDDEPDTEEYEGAGAEPMAAESNAALTPPAAAAPAPGAAAPAPGAAAPATAVALPEVTTKAELIALAARLVDERDAPLPDRRDAREQCRDEDRVTPVLVADAVYVDEDGVTYDIVVVDDNGEAVGLDVESCDLVVRADH